MKIDMDRWKQAKFSELGIGTNVRALKDIVVYDPKTFNPIVAAPVGTFGVIDDMKLMNRKDDAMTLWTLTVLWSTGHTTFYNSASPPSADINGSFEVVNE